MVKTMKMSSKIWRMLSIVEKKEEKLDKNILVAASVIVAMAYQAAISPPGGVAAVDAQMNLATSARDANDSYDLQPSASLLAFFYYDLSNVFWVFNTLSFLLALSVFIMYISGLSVLDRKFVIWPIRVTMFTSLLSMTGAYVCAILATTPDNSNIGKVNNTRKGIVVAIIVYVALVLLLLLCLVIHFICYMVREITKKNASEEEAAADTTDIA